jgi:tetratricopeptide (TPR) repeat protein
LAALLDMSLLQHVQQGGSPVAAQETRLTLLETIREFALEQLDAHDAAETRARHAAYYARLVAEAAPHLSGPQQGIWLACLEEERANLRAALSWAQECDGPLGLRMATGLAPFWYARGPAAEGSRWLEHFLALTADSSAPDLAAVRAQALFGACHLAYYQGDFPRAVTLGEESLARYRDLGDPAGIARACGMLGMATRALSNFERAMALYEEALALYRSLGDSAGTAHTLISLGVVADDRDDSKRKVAFFEQGLALFRCSGDRAGLARALCNLADARAKEGDYGLGLTLLEEALALYRNLGDRWGEGFALSNMGEVFCWQGEYRRAVAVLEQALALRRDLGDKQSVIHTALYLATALRGEGRLERAVALYRESLSLNRSGLSRAAAALGLDCLAGIIVVQGQPARAARLWGAAAAARAAHGLATREVERPIYAQDVAAARAALGGDAFAGAWAAGASLPLEAAIAEALSEDVAGAVSCTSDPDSA